MATRKGINISEIYAAPHILHALLIIELYTLYLKKFKGRTKSYFILYLKINDHPTRRFNFGLSRIHLNGCMFELNF